jgi:AraC-like DNA-binding protein
MPDGDAGGDSLAQNVAGDFNTHQGTRPADLDGFFEISTHAASDPPRIGLVQCGAAYIGRIEAANHTFTRSFATVARHTTDRVLVVAIATGSLSGISSNGPLWAGPDEVVMLDLTETVTAEAGGLTGTVLLLPRSVIYSGQLAGAWWHGHVFPSRDKLSHLLGAMMREAAVLCGGGADRTNGSLVDPLVAMIDAALRGAEGDRPGSGAHSTSIVAVKRYIDDQLADPELAVASLARQFGMSRASLYREFASFGGIAEYIRHQRLQRAAHELRVGGRQPLRLSALAHKLGFKSAASFSRTFAAAYGMPPRQFRNKAIARAKQGDDVLPTSDRRSASAVPSAGTESAPAAAPAPRPRLDTRRRVEPPRRRGR